MLRDVIGTILGVGAGLNVAAYEVFSLRDADRRGSSLFHRFGIMTDDYTPKPAFDVLRQAVAGRLE